MRPGHREQKLLPDAAWELYRIEKSQVLRQCWLELAVWSSMPECLSGCYFEMEMWQNYALKAFAFHRKKWDGEDVGCCMLRWPEFVHCFERPFWDTAVGDWTKVFPQTYLNCLRISELEVRAAMMKKFELAVLAAAKERDNLYKEFYVGWKLFLWIYQPLFRTSAAKAMSSVIGLCHPPATDDQDRFFFEMFADDAQSVRVFLTQFGWNNQDYTQEIEAMAVATTRTTREEMSLDYPVLYEFGQQVFRPLLTTDLACELSFSWSKSSRRANQTDQRHDEENSTMLNRVRLYKEERRRTDTTYRASDNETVKQLKQAAMSVVKEQQRYTHSHYLLQS